MEGLNSPRYLLWNNTLGTVVSELGADEKVPVASLTKIMTALVALERRELDEKVVITQGMLTGLEGFVKVNLRAGQEVTVRDLLYATLLPSAGDAAQALAISTAGTMAGFVYLMNQRAGELGLTGTHFNNPVGMDEDNYSTVRDVSKLLREALRNPEFVQVFESFEQTLPSLGLTVKKTFERTKYIKGGKTGFTNDAGRCLASTAEIEGTEYILVTTGAALGQNVADALKVYAEIETEYDPMRLVAADEWLVRIPVRRSPTDKLEMRAETAAVAALKNDPEGRNLTYVYDGEREITRETVVGTKLGVWQVYDGENLLVTQDIYYRAAPEFYHQVWLIGGWGLSLVMTILMIVAGWKARKARSSKTRKIAKIVVLATGVVLALSLIGNGLWLKRWLRNDAELEINQPELVVVDEMKNQTSGGEMPAQSEPKADDAAKNDKPTQSNPSKPVAGNCTLVLGNLMLINPNFKVGQDLSIVDGEP